MLIFLFFCAILAPIWSQTKKFSRVEFLVLNWWDPYCIEAGTNLGSVKDFNDCRMDPNSNGADLGRDPSGADPNPNGADPGPDPNFGANFLEIDSESRNFKIRSKFCLINRNFNEKFKLKFYCENSSPIELEINLIVSHPISQKFRKIEKKPKKRSVGLFFDQPIYKTNITEEQDPGQLILQLL